MRCGVCLDDDCEPRLLGSTPILPEGTVAFLCFLSDNNSILAGWLTLVSDDLRLCRPGRNC
jgi:hypothetical protein